MGSFSHSISDAAACRQRGPTSTGAYMKTTEARCSIIDGICLCALLSLCALAGCGKKQIAADSPPPVSPSLNPHSVTISWAASKSKVAGYNVYRAIPPAKPVKLTNGIVTGTEYIDTTVEAGRTYVYYVTSVDLTGVEGISSNGIEVTVPNTASAPASH
jgi:hypothetical protein